MGRAKLKASPIPAEWVTSQIDEVQFMETVYINQLELMEAESVANLILTRAIVHANQIGMVGRSVERWEYAPDTVTKGRMKLTFWTVKRVIE